MSNHRMISSRAYPKTRLDRLLSRRPVRRNERRSSVAAIAGVRPQGPVAHEHRAHVAANVGVDPAAQAGLAGARARVIELLRLARLTAELMALMRREIAIEADVLESHRFGPHGTVAGCHRCVTVR